MNVKWAATFVIVVGALAAWLAVAPQPDRGGVTTLDLAAPAPIDARGVALAKEIGRLRDRLKPGGPPNLGRDLFRFATAAPHAAPLAPLTNPAPSATAAAPPQPALKLIGIAEDTTTGGLVRTAIISGPDQLYVVKEGDGVTARYRVMRISSDVVELRDLNNILDNVSGSAVDDAPNDASVRRLALK